MSRPSYARLSRATKGILRRFEAGCALGFEKDGLLYDLSDEALDPTKLERSRDAKSEAAELARWRSMGRSGFEPLKA